MQSWAATGRAAVLVVAITVAVTSASLGIATLDQTINTLSAGALTTLRQQH